MADRRDGRRRIPLLKRIYVHLRMARNAYRVTAKGLRYPVAAGDTINLEVKLSVKIEGCLHG